MTRHLLIAWAIATAASSAGAAAVASVVVHRQSAAHARTQADRDAATAHLEACRDTLEARTRSWVDAVEALALSTADCAERVRGVEGVLGRCVMLPEVDGLGVAAVPAAEVGR